MRDRLSVSKVVSNYGKGLPNLVEMDFHASLSGQYLGNTHDERPNNNLNNSPANNTPEDFQTSRRVVLEGLSCSTPFTQFTPITL